MLSRKPNTNEKYSILSKAAQKVWSIIFSAKNGNKCNNKRFCKQISKILETLMVFLHLYC